MAYSKVRYKEYYYALKGLDEVFSEKQSSWVEENLVDEYEQFLREADERDPNALVKFNKGVYFSHDNERHGRYYKVAGIRAHIKKNLARVRSQLEVSEDNPALESRDFDFIQDADIKAILERDYKEIQKGVISGSWKSVIILSGGALEAILLDLLQKNSSMALSSDKKPQKQDLSEWALNDLIEVGLDTELVEPSVAKLSHSVRDYRNLIHPGNEKRSGLKVEPEEAKIALEVLNILIRDLG